MRSEPCRIDVDRRQLRCAPAARFEQRAGLAARAPRRHRAPARRPRTPAARRRAARRHPGPTRRPSAKPGSSLTATGCSSTSAVRQPGERSRAGRPCCGELRQVVLAACCASRSTRRRHRRMRIVGLDDLLPVLRPGRAQRLNSQRGCAFGRGLVRAAPASSVSRSRRISAQQRIDQPPRAAAAAGAPRPPRTRPWPRADCANIRAGAALPRAAPAAPAPAACPRSAARPAPRAASTSAATRG